MSGYRLEEVSGEAETLNQQESIALVASMGLGKSTGWFLTLMSGLTPKNDIAVGHANVAGDQGRPPRIGDIAGTGGGVRIRTVTDAGVNVKFKGGTWLSGEFPYPTSPLMLS